MAPKVLYLLESAEKTVDCRDSEVINEHEYKRVLRQRRLMAAATFGTLVRGQKFQKIFQISQFSSLALCSWSAQY